QLESLAGLVAEGGKPKLRFLEVNDNQLASLSGCESIPALERLLATGNGLSDISALAGLAVLREVDFRANPDLVEVDALGSLPLLGFLALGGGPTAPSLAPLVGAPVLQRLQIWDSGSID